MLYFTNQHIDVGERPVVGSHGAAEPFLPLVALVRLTFLFSGTTT